MVSKIFSELDLEAVLIMVFNCGCFRLVREETSW